MKSTKILSFVLMATSLLATATPAFAAETPHKVGDSKDTNATVKIIGKTVTPEKPLKPDDKDKDKPKPDQIANLKFIEAPQSFYFETSVSDDGYKLTADKTKKYGDKNAIPEGAKYQVFSDAKGAHYNVKSVIDPQLTEKATATKKVDVTSFKINDKEIASEGVVMDHTTNDFDDSGYATMPVENIAIEFKAADENNKIKMNEEYTGAIHNTLYNVYNEALETPTTPVK